MVFVFELFVMGMWRVGVSGDSSKIIRKKEIFYKRGV